MSYCQPYSFRPPSFVLRVPSSVFRVPFSRGFGLVRLRSPTTAQPPGTVPPHPVFTFHFSLFVLRVPFRATTRDRPYTVFHSQVRVPVSVLRSPFSGLRFPGLRLGSTSLTNHRSPTGLCATAPRFHFSLFTFRSPCSV